MTIAAFQQFMDAQARAIERRRRFNPDLTYAELHALSPDEQKKWWADLREHWSRGDRHLQGDYEHVDSRQRYELGE